MKRITSKEPMLALLAGAVLVIGISTTIYSTGYGGSPAAYAAAQTFTAVEKFPIDVTFFVPCGAGGAGEEIHMTGQVNEVEHVTLDNAGDAHVKINENFQGVSGTGLTTGDKYQLAQNFNVQFNTKVGAEETRVLTQNLIGQGNGNNALFHLTQHFTVNADGTVTAQVGNINIECK